MTFVRQSNLAPRNKSTFDPTRHLTRSDVVDRDDAIIIAIKWSKSQQGPTSTSVAAPAMPGKIICPREVYRRMLLNAPTRHPRQPVCSFRDGTVLPTSYMNKTWDRALDTPGCPKRKFTLHSLRRKTPKKTRMTASSCRQLHRWLHLRRNKSPIQQLQTLAT